MDECPHDGFHTGSARYDSATRTMHYVVICDACDQVIRRLTTERYTPSFDPAGAAEQLRALGESATA
jgi:hypothetical protein